MKAFNEMIERKAYEEKRMAEREADRQKRGGKKKKSRLREDDGQAES
jgi:hypothetical protein